MFQKIELRKTRDFSAKINVTFEFIRQNFKPLAKSLLYISGPLSLLGGIFMGIYQQNVLGLARSSNPLGAILSPSYALAILFVVFASLAAIVVTNTFVRLYETRPDPENIDVAEIWEGVKEDYFRVLGAGLVVIIVVCVGVVFLLIPGIYLGVTLSLITPIMVIERKSFSDAFSRCFALITDKWWSTFGLIVVTSMIVGFMGYIFQLPQLVLTFVLAFHIAHDALSEPPLWQQVGMIVSSVVATVGSNLLQGITSVALLFQFFNLVERREAQGLMSKLESFGKTELNTPKNDESY
jgi:hypothetical protein